MRLGVCYYPEQWPEERWAHDARMMADIGLELVRIGEFAWSTYEPARGVEDFDWLDRAIDTLASSGLEVVLGTPTATPPVWLSLERPDILSVDPHGRRRPYGSRRHTCPTSGAYREESARIVERLGQRYGQHQAVVAWQIDNEPGNHDSARCWCEECQDAFSGWLLHRYGTVEALNDAWGTAFWSQTYPSFESVRLPVPTMTSHSPSLLLAHRRFASEQVVAALKEQYDLLEPLSPGRLLTTNLYLFELDVDAHQVMRLGGAAAFDSYPHGSAEPADVAYRLDFARGAAGPGRETWIMEQQPGPINWTEANPPVPPGQLTDWVTQAAAAGVDTLLFFRWRAARYGQEQYHSGLLRHDGTPTRAHEEVRALAIGDVTKPRATVALLHSWDDAWALDIDPHAPGFDYLRHMVDVHAAARGLGHAIDIVPPGDALTGYQVVLAPYLHLASPERSAALESAVGAGATIVVGPRALVKDRDDNWVNQRFPAGITDHLGGHVAEFLAVDEPISIVPWNVDAGRWLETMDVTGEDTAVLASYANGYVQNAPAVIRSGSWVYVGCSSRAAWAACLELLIGRA